MSSRGGALRILRLMLLRLLVKSLLHEVKEHPNFLDLPLYLLMCLLLGLLQLVLVSMIRLHCVSIDVTEGH